MYKLLLIIILILFAQIKCASSISGKDIRIRPVDGSLDCGIKILRNKECDGNVIKVIRSGDIKSNKCNENEILNIIKKEACWLGADVVVLKMIENYNAEDSCFRMNALLIQSDSLKNNNTEKQKNNIGKIIGSVMLIFVVIQFAILSLK